MEATNEDILKKRDQPQISRRNVVKLGIGGAVATGLAALLRWDQDRKNQPPRNVSTLRRIDTAGNAYAISEDAVKKADAAVQDEENDTISQEVPKQKEVYFYPLTNEESLFLNLSKEEKNRAYEKMREIDLSRTPEDIERCRNLRGPLMECVEELKGMEIYIDPFVYGIAPALLEVESRGIPDAKNEKSGAIGLGQLLPSTAEEIISKIGIDTSNIEEKLKDPKINIKLSLLHLDRLYKLFPDLAVAVWGYHLGEGNMMNVIRAYLNRDDVVLAGEGYKTSDAIKDNHITFMGLLESDVVKNKLAEMGANNDETEKYTLRVAIANNMLLGKAS